ncbi:MAG: hypothetical protein FWD59_01525 [Micrococcales bacterium]|nr:hypothetical protein [Micrococcales bacterium]
MSYQARVTAHWGSGAVTLRVEAESLVGSTPLDAWELPYSDITSLTWADYLVTLASARGVVSIDRLGQPGQAFFDALLAAYNAKVARALFATGTIRQQAEGFVQVKEGSFAASARGDIAILDDAVLFRPPSVLARRIPLAFVSSLVTGEYETTLGLVDGSQYTLSRLGRRLRPMTDAIAALLRGLHETSRERVRDLDPTLSAAAGDEAARLLLPGRAASLSSLAAVAPSLVPALRARAESAGRAASFDLLAEVSGLDRMCVGLGTPLDPSDGPPTVWMMAASRADAPAGGKSPACLEMALGEEDASATFRYEFPGPWEEFWPRLNRAIEAIEFRREVISLPEEALFLPQHSDAAMSVQRTWPLRFVREAFAGRIIHSEVWGEKATAFLAG